MKLRRLLLTVAIIGAAHPAAAQDLHSMAPPEILKLDSIPNAGRLLLRYCLAGDHVCVERSTSCHGQCCDQHEADDIGYACYGNVYGGVPPLYHYAGWRCSMYSTPTSDFPLEGLAGERPNYPNNQCKNSR